MPDLSPLTVSYDQQRAVRTSDGLPLVAVPYTICLECAVSKWCGTAYADDLGHLNKCRPRGRLDGRNIRWKRVQENV